LGWDIHPGGDPIPKYWLPHGLDLQGHKGFPVPPGISLGTPHCGQAPPWTVRIPSCVAAGVAEAVTEPLTWVYTAMLAVQWAIDPPDLAPDFWTYDLPAGTAPAAWFGEYSPGRVHALGTILRHVVDRYTSRWRPLIVGEATGAIPVLWENEMAAPGEGKIS